MKSRHILIVGLSLFMVMMVVACSNDFLNRVPQDTLVDASFYQNDEQILSGTALLYSSAWKGYIDKANYTIGDFRGGTTYCRYCNRDAVEFKMTEVSDNSEYAYQGFFNVVAQANMVIYNINKYAGIAVTDKVKNHALAEARFMRATAYTYLVMNYGPVPVIENNLEHLGKPDLLRNTEESVWEFIKRDYEYAAENLMEAPSQSGRLTKWSAEAMLARTYLTIAGLGATPGARDQDDLDMAKEYAQRVITMSGKSLLGNYEDLFKYPYDNNNESLFELQWVYSTAEIGYNVGNSMISQISPYSALGANGEGWGSDQGATLWMLSLYDSLVRNDGATPGFTLDDRLKATYLMPGETYSYMLGEVVDNDGNKSNEPFTVPRDGNDGSVLARIKKYIPGKISGVTLQQRYPNNTYMLRLAEMYLIYAEAALGNNTNSYSKDGDVLDHFNAIHERAGLPPVDSVNWQMIFNERAKEFAMEGMSWYDLVRLHYYNETDAYDIINAQYRGFYRIVPNQWPNPTAWSFEKVSSSFDYATASSANFLLPFPASEISQAPSLSLEPVPYEFKE